MKKISLAIVLLFVSFFSYAQPADQQEAMKAWMEYMTPGKMHQWMAQMDGKWKTELSMLMGPGMDAMKSAGVNENSMLLDGRYQQIH